MRNVKSERLKKFELELQDLEQWLKLGLVPKRDIEKHKQEIIALQAKIEEEKERLQFLKESGDLEEYTAPKKGGSKTAYTEMPTIPDIDIADTAGGHSESRFDTENETSVIEERDDDDSEATKEEDDEEATELDEDEESYFSEKNRWRRGGIVDPDADEW